MFYFRALILAVAFSGGAGLAQAQGTNVAFGTTPADPTLPVEVTSETLDVDQEDGSAEFKGDVVVVQGEMRLTAQRVLVIYNEENSGIERMEATGDVVLVNGLETAEGDRADYTIDTGIVIMTGDVLLTQGANTLLSEKMTVNLVTGTAQMVGRVRTILNPDGN